MSFQVELVQGVWQGCDRFGTSCNLSAKSCECRDVTSRAQEKGIAWDMSEWGNSRTTILTQYVIPTSSIFHGWKWNILYPWVYMKGCQNLEGKDLGGDIWKVQLQYWSKWFVYWRKMEITPVIHTFNPWNAITIKDSGATAHFGVICDSLGGHGCYTGLSMFVAFDHRSLSVQSHNLTLPSRLPLAFLWWQAFSIGSDQLCSNFTGNVSTCKDEMPDTASCLHGWCQHHKGPPTHYRTQKMDGIHQLPSWNPHHHYNPVPCAFQMDLGHQMTHNLLR